MIGCLLTGHGSFAPGLTGALEMIAGQQDNFETVPFKEDDGLDTFQANVAEALAKLQEKNDSVIIFCDLLGGTPFNVSMMVSNAQENVAVIAGTNLPLLIEFAGMRLAEQPMEELIAHILEVGKAGVTRATLDVQDDAEVEEEEEGI